MSHRLLGAMAALGGIAWIIGVALAYALPTDEYGDHDNIFAVTGLAIGASLMGIVLGQLGTGPRGRSRVRNVIAIAGIALGLTVAMGWPMFMVFLIGYPILVIVAAARGYLTGGLPAWSVAVIESVAVLGLLGVLGLPELFGNGDAFFVLFGLIGAAGPVLAVAAVRPPVSTPTAEVSAA